jgi:hypothetical protein
MRPDLISVVMRRRSRAPSKLWRLASVVLASLIFCLPSLRSQTPLQPPSTAVDEITLRIIVVSSQEKAQHILERLEKGENFAALARQESIDSTADDGGSMGKVTLSSLRPELRNALQGVGPGQFSPVVQLPAGYAILEVVPDTGVPTNNPGVNQASSAIGSVKYTFQLGGFAEVESDIANFSKPSGWNQDPRKICEIRKQSIAAEKQSLEKFLFPADRQAQVSHPPEDVFYAHYSLGELSSYQGEMDAAIEQYKKAYGIARSSLPAWLPCE